MAQALFQGSSAYGTVRFDIAAGTDDVPPLAGGVEVTIQLYNLTDGVHGIHIHAGDADDDCELAGAHFCIGPSWGRKVPEGIPHGSWALGTPRHTGDLCNNVISRGGLAFFQYTDDLISMNPTSPAYIVGRSVVVHADADDCGFGNDPKSKVSGNAGGRVACAVIR